MMTPRTTSMDSMRGFLGTALAMALPAAGMSVMFPPNGSAVTKKGRR